MTSQASDIDVNGFLKTGFDLKAHLMQFLRISSDQLEVRLPNSLNDMASLHPGSFSSKDVISFYENEVGNYHLLELLCLSIF